MSIELLENYDVSTNIDEKFLIYKYGSKKIANFEVLERENWVVIRTFNKALQKDTHIVIVKDDMLTELIKQLQIIEKNI